MIIQKLLLISSLLLVGCLSRPQPRPDTDQEFELLYSQAKTSYENWEASAPDKEVDPIGDVADETAPRIVYILRPDYNCPVCVRQGKELGMIYNTPSYNEPVVLRGLKFIPRYTYPDFFKNKGGFPIMWYEEESATNGWDYEVGWSTLDDFIDILNGEKKVEAQTVSKRPLDFSHSSVWELKIGPKGNQRETKDPGQLRKHLISDHGYSAGELDGLSVDQLVALHSHAHEAEQKKSTAGVRYQYIPKRRK